MRVTIDIPEAMAAEIRAAAAKIAAIYSIPHWYHSDCLWAMVEQAGTVVRPMKDVHP